MFKLMESYHVLNIFNHLGPFLEPFGLVKEWLTLEQHEMIRVLHLITFPVSFKLLCDLGE